MFGEGDLTYDHVHRQLCQQTPDRGQFTSTVQCSLLFEISNSSLDTSGWRGIDEHKRKRISKTHALHLQEQDRLNEAKMQLTLKV